MTSQDQIRPQTLAASPHDTVFAIILAIATCHLLNDMMQSLLPAIYPSLKDRLRLNFTQIGFVTLAFQCTASLLQPLVGFVGDKRSLPWLLPVGAAASGIGLLMLAHANSYPMLLIAASMVGIGSSTFHPESSRVIRMASGGRHGLAQSMFQVGGNMGSALGPLLAAFIVVGPNGQGSVIWFAIFALLSIIILAFVAQWHKGHGVKRARAARPEHFSHLSKKQVAGAFGVLLTLIFSKFFYLTAFTSYYTFYLIEHFHLSVRDSQIDLFIFLAAAAFGTFAGGPIGDRFGRKNVIWFSILGAAPFALVLPYADHTWTVILSTVISVIISSAFSAIVVFGQELAPGKVGAVSGLFFGFAFGMAGIGAAVLGAMADYIGIAGVYRLCAFLPLIGLVAFFLPAPDKR
jgi:FSR family fosmidomycin resistance protein-like MFS transporter